MEWKRGLCGICPAGCWVEVALESGKMVDIRPDNSHSLGTICSLGQHAVEIVYNEYRLKHPMRRIGSKGTYQFERITWDEAYDAIVAGLNKIKAESGPEALTVYTGRGAQELSLCDMFQPKGVAVSSASSVLFPFGSPNTTGVGALCYVSLHVIAPQVTLGRMGMNMFADIENSGMIVIWGTNPATDSPPVDMHRLEKAVARGADIVVIDPRRTETITLTNAQWIPIRPGTDGALALSLIEVLIDEDLYDEDFAENWCHGFEELKVYTQHFRPETVGGITGIPAETIRGLARRIAQADGASPLLYTGLEFASSGVQSARAVYTLFALAGHLDVPGGIGLSMLNSEFPINRSCNQPNPDLNMAIGRKGFPLYSLYRGESHAIGLVRSTLRGEPYQMRGLIIEGASLLTSWPQTSIWQEMLSKLDFLVCIDRQFTADAAYADIVLPATTMFENLSYMVYGPIFRIREKIIKPLGEARNDFLIMSELAKRLGHGEFYPQTEEAMLRLVLEGSGHTPESVRNAGGWIRIPVPILEYKKWQKGGLRPDGKPGFNTPTGKFEIWSTLLEEYGYEPLPKYVEPKEGPIGSPTLGKKYPLVFSSGASIRQAFRSQHHGVPGLVSEYPEPTMDMNIIDAEGRGIQTGDLVNVTTPRGSVSFRARVSENIIPGVIECSMGGGTPVGPKAWQKGNVNELTDLDNYDEISGFPVYKSLLCEVIKLASGDTKDTGTIPFQEKTENIRRASQSRESKRLIYLDNNATTPVAGAVKEAMLPYLDTEHGNPSSIHSSGRDARMAMEKSRRQVAALINASPRRIIFTGGGSEADNLALKGVAYIQRDRGHHIITTAVEHPAVLNTARFLEKSGFKVTYLEVDNFGYIDPEKLREAITDDTILVSIMLANNETGTILPVKELCDITHERNIIFHTDAVQAVGKIEVDVQELGVDLLSISGHKFRAPKGIGALYTVKGIVLEPLIHGGQQEGGFRAGTENIASIVGLGKASEIAAQIWRDADRIAALRDRLEDGIRALVPGAMLNGHPIERLPNTLNMTLPELRGESIVIAMDQHGIALSSGSACKSGSPEPTHVLLAMGRTREEAHCSVRFSLGSDTIEKDIEETLEALRRVLLEKDVVRLIPCK
jgi:cysteine desulfurase NifS